MSTEGLANCWYFRRPARASTPEKQEYFNKLRDAVDPLRTDLTSWADLQDLEEGRSVPRREPAPR